MVVMAARDTTRAWSTPAAGRKEEAQISLQHHHRLERWGVPPLNQALRLAPEMNDRR